MTKLTIEKLKHPISKQLVLKISGIKANDQGDADFEVSKISNLIIDVKNQVFSEVIEPVETRRK